MANVQSIYEVAKSAAKNLIKGNKFKTSHAAAVDAGFQRETVEYNIFCAFYHAAMPDNISAGRDMIIM